MHEIGIVQSLINLAESEIRDNGYSGPVRSLTIRVGRLSGAQPEAIRFAFEVISAESPLSGAKLNIIEVKPKITCQACGKISETDELKFECPLCGSSEINISGGDDLNLESIELEES